MTYDNVEVLSGKVKPDQKKVCTKEPLFFACWVNLHSLLSSADFFQNRLFRKILSGIHSQCQTVWIQIRPDVVSSLIWVQTVCKSYQQTTLVDKELIAE